MITSLKAIREDLVVLTRLYGRNGRGDWKALCLALIDHVATYATDRHGEIPDDALGCLTRAMYAAGRGDVAGVIEEMERALTLLGGQHRKLVPGTLSMAGKANGPRTSAPSEPQVYKPKTLAQRFDPLLAKLRTKRRSKG